MSWWILALAGWAVMALVMAGLWAWQKRTNNAGIVDVAWSFGTGLMGTWFAIGVDGDPVRRGIVAVMAATWGARLGWHLFKRVTSESEDARYADLRERWGEKTQRNLFIFFQVQATWTVLFAAPMLVAARRDGPFDAWDAAGIWIWLVALGGEALADRQLARFRERHAGEKKVCREGLWRWSRHPNYFFEWVHWWAYVAIGITGAWGWLTLAGPAIMLFFLLKVTGIPPTERRMLESRGEAFRAYQRTTNAFFPWPPREDPEGAGS